MDPLHVAKLDDPKLKIDSVVVMPGKGSRGATQSGLLSSDALLPSASSGGGKNPFFRPPVVNHAVFVGTNDGCVTHYTVTLNCITHSDQNTAPPENLGFYVIKEAVQAQKRDLGCGKHSVPYLHADAVLNRLICLCDGTIKMLSTTLDVVPTFASIKQMEGASCCAVAEKQDPGNARLVCLVKKQLICIDYSENTASPSQISEETQPIAVSDSVNQLAWHHNVIITGSKREYTLYDAKTHQLIDQVVIEKTASGPLLKPVLTIDGIRVACKNGNILYLYDGKQKSVLEASQKIEFEEEVSSFSFAYPYVTAVTPTGKFLQHSRLDEADIPAIGEPKTLPLRCEASFRPFSYVATAKELMVLVPIPHIKQVGRYVMAGQFERAVMHFERTFISTASQQQMTSPQLMRRESMASFSRKESMSFGSPRSSGAQFGTGGEMFDDTSSEHNGNGNGDFDDPMSNPHQAEEYVGLLKKVHYACALESFARGMDEVAFYHFDLCDPDIQEMIDLYPELRRPKRDEVKLSVSERTTRERTRSVVQRRQGGSVGPATPVPEASNSRHDSPVPEGATTPNAEGEGKNKQHQYLYDFLKKRRVQSDTPSDTERAVDYAILKLLLNRFVQVTAQEIKDLFLPSNSLDFNECRELVTNPMRPRFYTLLLATNGKFKEALRFCKDRGLVDEAALPLQLSGDTTLFSEHFPWMVVANPMAAVKAVSTPTRNPPPPSLVLSIIGGSAGQPLREYLNFVINYLRSKEERVHTLHACNLVRMTAHLQKFSGTPDLTLSLKPGTEPGLLGELRAELVQFLGKSLYYDADVVMSTLMPTRLVEEQAVVFSRDDDHHSALSVLVYKMKSVSRAEEYCLTHFQDSQKRSAQASTSSMSYRDPLALTNQTSTPGSGLTSPGPKKTPKSLGGGTDFTSARLKLENGSFGSPASHGEDTHRYNEYLTVLLKVLLVPPLGEKQRLNDAIRILDLYSRDVNPVSIMKSLPSDVKMESVAPYLKRIFQTLGHKKSLVGVERKCVESQVMTTERYRSLLQQRSVFVDDDRMCVVCNTKISDAVIAVFPNLKVAHFRCFKDKELDPERGVPFREGNIF